MFSLQAGSTPLADNHPQDRYLYDLTIYTGSRTEGGEWFTINNNHSVSGSVLDVHNDLIQTTVATNMAPCLSNMYLFDIKRT